MKKFYFLLLLCLFGNVTPSSANVHTESNISTYHKDFNKQLFIISNTADKDHALKELQQLFMASGLSAQQKFSVLFEQGKLLYVLTRYQEAIEQALQAKAIVQEIEDNSLIAKADNLLGVVYYYQGELDKALLHYQQSLAFYNDKGDLNNSKTALVRANLFNNLALVFSSMGDSTNSLYHYQQAEALYQAYGSEADKVDVRFNIALLHVNLKRFGIAIGMLKETITQFNQFQDKLSAAKATAGLGIAYKYSGQYKLAEKNILEALTYFQLQGHRHDTASQFHNISAVYTSLGDYKKAQKYAEKAIVLSQQVGHQKAHAGSLQVLAKIYFFQGAFLLAQESIELSNAIAKKINYKTILIDNLAISALIYAGLGQQENALNDFYAHERHQHEADNLMLNEQLAKFESEQLAQQVIQLRQAKRLEELQSAKTDQRRSFILLSVVLLLLLIFFVYRRYLESRVTAVLEKRVQQRTNELELTGKRLRKANKIKSQFLANMSHEIRTPLTAIVGHAEAIIHRDVNHEDLIKEVDVIHGNSLHLLALINDILDLSKIEAEKFQLELRPQNLEVIIQELGDMFAEQAQRKGLTFTIQHQISFPFIIDIDARRVRQVLINLCSNAIKFTAKGSVTLTVDWSIDRLKFTVIDTGIGLKSKQIAQVFEVFTQADSSISRRFGGSGLGLSLSNELARLMGGEITVQSEAGKGSCFSFILPCSVIAKTEPVDYKQTHKALESEAVKPIQITGKILLAEDHDDNRRLIARLLESLGLEVFCAKNGLEAIELCQKHQPRLVLLDIQMPEMDGITAFTQLRKIGFIQPIYALTANAMSHEVSQYITLGFNGHLKKPIERESFIHTIAQHYPNIDASKATAKLASLSLKDLTQDYKVSLQEELKVLTDYLTSHNQELLAKTVHRISGAGQMFGFTELSQAAKELDSYLKKISSEERVLTASEKKQQSCFIDDLIHCLIDEITLVQSA
ncbi:response regulator [Colwellia sp. D2M02]|uniref:ATP-binding protein n=1 Tax=Colwellia sp. D2M02 TaxID=2841562 RepID=UPI001C082303|nr:ATP-binding protein [Colwellia sp. D2M02]MBU2894851.1 response regulator [Colwellia sp. D2M02]